MTAGTLPCPGDPSQAERPARQGGTRLEWWRAQGSWAGAPGIARRPWVWGCLHGRCVFSLRTRTLCPWKESFSVLADTAGMLVLFEPQPGTEPGFGSST